MLTSKTAWTGNSQTRRAASKSRSSRTRHGKCQPYSTHVRQILTSRHRNEHSNVSEHGEDSSVEAKTTVIVPTKFLSVIHSELELVVTEYRNDELADAV